MAADGFTVADNAVALSQAIARVFQDDGVYAGTRDVTLRSDQPTANFGSSSKVESDGQPATAALLQWDVSTIPLGSVVTGVTMQLNINNASSDAYQFFQLLHPWSETQANWNQASAEAAWDAAGGGEFLDRNESSLGVVNASATGLTSVAFGPEAVAMVQQWIDDPQSNFGITIRSSSTDGMSFSSRDAGTTALRPKLSIVYATDSSALPPAAPVNSAPLVNAGSDQNVVGFTSANLDGAASDDGLPDPAGLTSTWTKVSGPGSVAFDDASAVDTLAIFSTTGAYVLRLSVSDGQITTSDDVQINVNVPASSGALIRFGGVYNQQTRISSPGDGARIDLAGGKFYGLQNAIQLNPWPDPITFGHKSENLYPEADNLYPLTIKGGSKDFQIRGGFVQGLLDPMAPWHVWKNIADGDGLRVEGLGNIDVSSIRIDNVEDGFSPHTASDSVSDVVQYTLHDAYFTRIHDDMVENDAVRNLDVRDVYMEGHTFYSARGTANPNAQVNITNAVVQLTLMPHQGSISGASGDLRLNTAAGYPFPDGLGTGSILKLDDGGMSGHIHIKDSVFLVPRASTSSFDAMSFNANNGVTYENVTVVWLGDGDYPDAAPPGVTITRDRTIFDNAKAAFFAVHPQFVAGTLDNFTPPLDTGAIITAYAPPSPQLPIAFAAAASVVVYGSAGEVDMVDMLLSPQGTQPTIDTTPADQSAQADDAPATPAAAVDEALLHLLSRHHRRRAAKD